MAPAGEEAEALGGAAARRPAGKLLDCVRSSLCGTPRGKASGESLLRLLFGIFILSTMGHEAEGEFYVAS